MATSIGATSVTQQRKPEDYLARQKAQEEEERLEKSKYQRRFGSDKRSDKDVNKRRSYIPPRTVDDEAQKAAREYRQKRRSLNLDKKTDISDKSDTKTSSRSQRASKQASVDTAQEKELQVSTDATDSFAPESASSPRPAKSSESGPISPRSATSPPRPSTKRKLAPPPPCSPVNSGSGVVPTELSSAASSSVSKTSSKPAPPPPCSPRNSNSGTVDFSIATSSTSSEVSNSQPKSPQSKIPKPVSNQTNVNSNTTSPQEQTEPAVNVPQIPEKSSKISEPSAPSRPPRRKKKSEENRSFLHDSFDKEERKSKEIAVNVDIKDTTPEVTYVNIVESDLPEPDTFQSLNGKEDSLLDAVIKELPDFKRSDKPNKKVEFAPVNGINEEVIVANVDSNVECEIQPQRINKTRGKFDKTEVKSNIEFKDRNDNDDTNVNDSDDDNLVITSHKSEHTNNNLKDTVDIEPVDYMEQIEHISFSKKDDDLKQIFDRIGTLPGKVKDTKDTQSIASDISSAGSEAPPLPDSAPPPFLTQTGSASLSASLSDVSEVIEPVETKQVETSPDMAEVMPEITEKASPREVTSPINDLRASMFSMRVKSPTLETEGYKANGELRVDTGLGDNDENSDSDISDDEKMTAGTFTPGAKVTKDIPMKTSEDNGEIQLISFNTKLNSPNSDSAFEDMQSSMTSNDHLSNTYDELSPPEDFVTMETVDKVESTPKKEVKSFVLEFDTDAPKKPSGVLSPNGNKSFMMKAQQFADTVQRPPKMTVKLKREINTPQDISDERYLQLEAERRAVISSSTMKKRDLVPLTTANEEEVVEQPPSPDPDNAVQEWRTEVSKRSNIPWEEKPDKVNLYSENIIQESENTDAVDRESIANLSSVREKWEVKFQKKDDNNVTPKKQTNKQVRHWEVKLPTQLKKVPADVVRSTKADSDSEPENMAEVDNSNESAIEREIRLAMEREQLLKKEQEERASLQTKQMASVKKEFENNNNEQNNNKPTYHEMTEADRGSELQQREEMIQQELQQQEEREADVRGTTRMDEESSHSSAEEEENESIIEREIRLQQERERELEMHRQQLVTTSIKDDEEEEEIVTEEVVTIEYSKPIEAPPTPEDDTPASTMDETPVSTPDDLSEAEEQAVNVPDLKSRISYEEAISSASHEGESLIARELREAREREEELQRQRELASSKVSKTSKAPEKQPVPQSTPVVKESTKVVETPKPTYQKDVSPFKKERRQSTDSLSSGQSSEKPANITKNVRVGGATLTYRKPDKPKDTKRQETPIEREIRLARERENEFRVAKGLPPLKDETKVDYDIPEESVKNVKSDVQVTKRSFFSPQPKPDRGDNIQRFASSMLQKEINKQTAIERKYRDEGKIKSTSEDHVGLIKYTDIAQKDLTTPPKRNFSIQRKGVSSEPVVEQKQNGTPEPTPTKAQTPDQPAKKFSRSVSSGNVTFSYKESKHKAESKIEQELREMREREEELRNQRAGAGIASPSSPRSPTSTSVVNKRSQFEQTS